MTREYLFKSERLGFRNWVQVDIPLMTLINTDSEVMEFFPGVKNEKETIEFIERMRNQFSEKGYCYFAVDQLDSQEFVGFIGISEQTFEADFTPCIDIGWRLNKSVWNKGYATEGAKRCLSYATSHLGIKKINAVAPVLNLPSLRVMEKIGMTRVQHFIHPLLKDDERLRDCVLYEIML